MPFPVAAAIAAGASLAGTAANFFSDRSLNISSMRNLREQRKWALEDWYREAAYNDPSAQMARLRAAGLNPNLVYGSGQATRPAPSVRGTDAPNLRSTDFSGIGRAAIAGIEAYQDVRLQDQQVQNMQTQRENMKFDLLLKTADLASKNLENAKNRRLFDTVISTAEEQLRSLKTSTDIRISKEVRDAALHAPNLLSAFERAANLAVDRDLARAQIANLKRTGVLQQMEINMRKLGLSYNDSVILRVLAQFAGGRSLPEVVRNLWDELQKLGAGFNSFLKQGTRTQVDVK